MSVGAKLLNAGVKMSGVKKKYTLPEAQYLETVRKMNRRRGFFLPKNRKAVYREHNVLGHKCLIVQKETKQDFDELAQLLAK